MNRVFLDTVGLLALWDEDDQWHTPATKAFDSILASNASLLTSEFILLECGNAAARRPYRSAVHDLREQLTRHNQLITPGADDIASAWSEYGKQTSSSPGIVDLVSIIIMKRLRIQAVFSNDKHFKRVGLNTLF